MARYAANARMSKQELILVKYVVRQLLSAYTDDRGKPRYARNMNQVMKDIFGVKGFSKSLERGIRNEREMIALMRTLDFPTIWTICRSSEHYRMLCALVAMDHARVKLQKQSDELLTMDPQSRPGRKYAKAQKELKRVQKSYNRTVKVFRNIFDIKSRSAGSSIRGIMEFAENWRDRNSGDDIFDYFGDGDLFDSVESMDSFVRRNSKGGGRDVKRPDRGGALGIFDNDTSFPSGTDDDDDYFDLSLDDDKEEPTSFLTENLNELVDRLANIIAQRYGWATPQAAAPTRVYQPNTYPRSVPTQPAPVPVAPDDRLGRLEQLSEQTNHMLGRLVDVLSGGGADEEYTEEELGEFQVRRAPGSDLSMEEALRMAEGGPAPNDAPAAPEGGLREQGLPEG